MGGTNGRYEWEVWREEVISIPMNGGYEREVWREEETWYELHVYT